MVYRIKEIFYTLQGEGRNAGRAAVFCRFSGCNLWSGLEQHRADATCNFCDTDFVGVDGPGGGVFSTADDLAAAIAKTWPQSPSAAKPLVVCTGGEPLLQLDAVAVTALRAHNFEIAVETNGTVEPPAGLDWLCVSPKAGAEIIVRSGDELKLIYPQVGAEPERFASLAFDLFYLQPMDGPRKHENTKAAVEYCLQHPQWRMSLQTHKLLSLR